MRKTEKKKKKDDQPLSSSSSSSHQRTSLAINVILGGREQEKNDHIVSQLKPLYSEALLASIGLQ
jgi:hypothetical protein